MESSTENELKKWVVQQLDEAYAEFRMKTKKRRVSDKDFARWLNIPPSSLSGYVNGNYIPDYANAIRMSERLGREFMEHLGYGYTVQIRDPKLKFVVENWSDLDSELRNIIFDHVKEEVNKSDGNQGNNDQGKQS